jgi:hypothetical protein
MRVASKESASADSELRMRIVLPDDHVVDSELLH